MELLFLSPHESGLCTYHHELVDCVWLWYFEIQISPQEPPNKAFWLQVMHVRLTAILYSITLPVYSVSTQVVFYCLQA